MDESYRYPTQSSKRLISLISKIEPKPYSIEDTRKVSELMDKYKYWSKKSPCNESYTALYQRAHDKVDASIDVPNQYKIDWVHEYKKKMVL